jgi:hypothetical protein
MQVLEFDLQKILHILHHNLAVHKVDKELGKEWDKAARIQHSLRVPQRQGKQRELGLVARVELQRPKKMQAPTQ